VLSLAFLDVYGYSINTIMFAVASGTTISCSLGRQ
jgi:hypothetical protein